MDKTIEIVIVATVVIMTALAVMFMVSGQAGDFGDWTNDTQTEASCSLQKTQWENACSQGDLGEAQEIKSDAQSNSCDWPDNAQGCAGS
jgi:hypothetical protein